MIAGAALIGLLLAVMVGPRDNHPFLANTAQLLKRPGVVLVAKTPGEFKQDGQIVKKFIPQNWQDFTSSESTDSPLKKDVNLEFHPKDGGWVSKINFKQGRWDRNYIYADSKDIKRSTLHEKMQYPWES